MGWERRREAAWMSASNMWQREGWVHPPCPPRPGPQGCVCTGASWVIKHKNVRIKYLLRLTLHKLPAKHQGCPASCGSTQSPQSNNFVPSSSGSFTSSLCAWSGQDLCAPRTLHVWFCWGSVPLSYRPMNSIRNLKSVSKWCAASTGEAI